jgi:CRP-like cAMP-binding protein
LKLLQDYPSAADAATKSLLREYDSALRAVCRFVIPKTAAGRVADLLLEWGNYYGGETRPHRHVILALKHSAIAEMLGITRETVARILGQFHREGLIELNGNSLLILRADVLESLAGRMRDWADK